MKILLATPTYDGTCTTEYMVSVIGLLSYLRRERPDCGIQLQFTRASLVARARNAFASIVLADPAYTHLLFVDTDIGFRPEAVGRLLDSDREVCGCLYPFRTLEDERLHAVSRTVANPVQAAIISRRYVGREYLVEEQADGAQGMVIEPGGFVRTRRLGMGFTLIRREALERMRDRYPELVCASASDRTYAGLGVPTGVPVLQCFEPVQASDGVFLSEDYSFCERWTAGCSGELWACVTEVLTHTGPVTVMGRPFEQLQHEHGEPRRA